MLFKSVPLSTNTHLIGSYQRGSSQKTMAQTSPPLFNILIFLVSFDFGARRSPVKRFDFYFSRRSEGMDAGMRGWSAWRHGLGNLVSSKLQLGKQSKELSELCAEKDDNYKSRVSFIVLNSALNLFQLLWKAQPAFLLWSLPHPSWFYWIHVLTRKVGPTIPDSYNGFNGRRKMARPDGFEPSTHCLEGSCSIQLS